MTNRKRIAAGNWKMNTGIEEGIEKLKGLDSHSLDADTDVIICAPFTHLWALTRLTFSNRIQIGAQDVSKHASGAFTGEISASMLKGAGVSHVIIGHSERREYHGESASLLKDKLDAALDNELVPIFCCGEPLEIRKNGTYVPHVLDQLEKSLGGYAPGDLESLIIAYEPIWAIGTGETASPDQAQEMHQAIREFMGSSFDQSLAIQVPILYGGSVKPGNAKEIFSKPDVDGGLVGGASLDPAGFAEIANSFG